MDLGVGQERQMGAHSHRNKVKYRHTAKGAETSDVGLRGAGAGDVQVDRYL